jgi:hypothetical protein
VIDVYSFERIQQNRCLPLPLHLRAETDPVSDTLWSFVDRLSGLVVRVPGYRSRGPGFEPGATGFSEK